VIFKTLLHNNWKKAQYYETAHTSAANIYHISISPVNHNILAIGGGDFVLLDLSDREPIFSRKPAEYVWGTCFDTKGNVMFGSNPGVKVYDESAAELKHFQTTSNVWCMHLHKNILAAGSVCVHLWNYETTALITELPVGEIISCVYIDDHWIIAGTYLKTLYVWNRADLTTASVLHGHQANIRCMSVVDDIALTASDDDCVIQWDLINLKIIRTYRYHNGPVLGIYADKTKYVSVSLDGTACMKYYKDDGDFYIIDCGTALTCVKFTKTHLIIGSRIGKLFVYDFTPTPRNTPFRISSVRFNTLKKK